uniref:Uncharacterized protein n=1 Tax=Tetranychus urticae TaxID=32264 RepID=T1KS08_TETUR
MTFQAESYLLTKIEKHESIIIHRPDLSNNQISKVAGDAFMDSNH